MDKLSRYENALSNFAKPGNRFAMIPELTATGKAAGLAPEDIIADARNVGVTNRDADIRRMFDGSVAVTRRTGYYCRRRSGMRTNSLPGAAYPHEVRSRIEHGVNYDSFDALMGLSPVDVARMEGMAATRAHLGAMFKPSDLILVGTMKHGTGDRNLRTAGEWMADGRLSYWEQVKINPFTGDEAPGGACGTTRIGEKSIARFPHMLLEFDALPIEEQCRFWAGMILQGMPIVAIVYSGGKSLHGLVKVGAANEKIWWDRCNQAKALYCSDPDARYHADGQAMRPGVAMRLAGVVRRDTGRRQTLLYIDSLRCATEPSSASSGASGRESSAVDASAHEMRPAGILAHPAADGTNARYKCAICVHIDKCKYAFGRFWVEKSNGGIGCNCCRWGHT